MCHLLSGVDFWPGCDGVAFCLAGGILSCLVAVGSPGDILKSIGGAINIVFKVRVGVPLVYKGELLED